MQSPDLDHSAIAIIQTQCAMLVARYCHLADERDNHGFAQLFTPAGEWIRPNMHMKGRADILKFMESLPNQATRHMSGSVHVEVIDRTHARGRSYCALFREQGGTPAGANAGTGPAMVVNYEDEFVSVDGQWYIAKRVTTVAFAAKP